MCITFKSLQKTFFQNFTCREKVYFYPNVKPQIIAQI